ncbi:MAG: glycerophosphodiester phosphodiesterase family protein [Planctomycetaceae bacterium]|nr:glycerophosphodiester phosphodiesterase family protein [Planctomycetaceae bacterium]
MTSASGFLNQISLAEETVPKIQVVAHRGHHTRAPENTIQAIQSAIDIGCDFVEIDVRTTADGKLVLMHDSSVDRTTTGTGKISTLSLQEVQQLDSGIKKDPAYKGTLVPTFREALRTSKGKIGIYLDHKDADVEQVVPLLKEFGMIENTIVYCGSTDILKAYKQLAPEIRLMTGHPETAEELINLMEDLHPETLDGNIRDWTAPQAELARKLGAELWFDCLGDTDTTDHWNRALELKATGIQTDHPEKLIGYLKSRGRK